MFLLFGLNSFHRTSAAGPGTCRFCGRHAPRELTESGTRLTVFFVPVWTFGRSYSVTCRACGGRAPVGRREAARARRG